MLRVRRISLITLCLIAFVVGIFLCSLVATPSLTAMAEGEHQNCEGYCLVCDLAEKINALPNVEDINMDNLAGVIQQINNIDRIKYDLTDEQFEELTALVETHDDGVDHNVITRYSLVLDKARELSGSGVNFAISKSFYMGEEGLSDTSEAEVSFLVTNVDTESTTTLSLFDLGMSTSALGDDFYGFTAEGWRFGYVLPKGNYTIEEINLDKPIIVNGKADYYHCVSVSDGVNTYAGNKISITLADEPVSVMFGNTKCENLNGVATEGEGESYITCDCPVCGEGTAVATITAPAGAIYDGSTTYPVALSQVSPSEFHFSTSEELAQISYEYKKYNDDAWVSVAESDTYKAGRYKATLTLAGATTSVEYNINYPEARILFVSKPGSLTYGSISGGISVLIKEEEGMRYEYQWYDESNTAIEGEVDQTFSLPYNLNAGQHVYTVEVRSYDALDTSADPMYSSVKSVIYIDVDKRIAVVKISDQYVEYGEEQQELSAMASGIAYFDNESEVYELNCIVDATSSVGDYKITGTTISSNYEITFIEGTYTVTKRYLDLDVSSITIEYGEELKELEYGITLGSLANGESEEDVFCVFTNADSYSPGEYAIEVQTLNSNYHIFAPDAYYYVNARKVSVTFGDDRTFIYNADYQHPSYTCSDPDAEPIIQSEVNVGIHTAVVTGFTSPAYELETPVSVEYEILPTAITIKADDLSKQVGETDPKLTFTITGMVYGNYGFRDLVLTREEGEEVGEYDITVTVDETLNTNYDITLVGGKFRIFNSIAGISAEFDELKANLDEALAGKASNEELEKAITELENAIKQAEDALKYADADAILKEELMEEIEGTKQEILEAVRTIVREETEKATGGESEGETVEGATNDSKMVLITVAGMGGVTVVMLIFLIVLFAKRLGRK